MCRSRSNRTDEWRPFRSEQREGTKRKTKGARRGKREGTFCELGCDARPCARLGFLVKRTYLPGPRNARPQKTRRTAIVLSVAAAKSACGSLHDPTLLRSVDFAFLSYVLLERRFSLSAASFCYFVSPRRPILTSSLLLWAPTKDA